MGEIGFDFHAFDDFVFSLPFFVVSEEPDEGVGEGVLGRECSGGVCELGRGWGVNQWGILY